MDIVTSQPVKKLVIVSIKIKHQFRSIEVQEKNIHEPNSVMKRHINWKNIRTNNNNC